MKTSTTFKKGMAVFIKRNHNASSNYRGAKGIVVDTPKNKPYLGVSLVSDNGKRATWAVWKSEIDMRRRH
jgi:hypothetical protein